MQAGDLLERVTLQTRTEVSDGHDGFTVTWSAVRSRIAAGVVTLEGRDLERARQIDPRISHEVTLRFWTAYGTDLDGGRARMIWHDDGVIGDRTFESVGPPRETDRRRALTLLCKELQ